MKPSTLKRLRPKRKPPGLRPLPVPKRPLTPGQTLGAQVTPPGAIVDLPGAYLPPDHMTIFRVYMLNEPKPFAPPCNIGMVEWRWRAVFNEAGDQVLLHSPCYIDGDFIVEPLSVMASKPEQYTTVITLEDGRRFRVRYENPPGWAGLAK